jgi:Zn-dependent protease
MNIQSIILSLAHALPGFLLAIVAHEWAHAYMAKRFGDNTAEREGRLTLNPVVHIDMMGTIVFPIILLMMGGMVFGWAKPVPIEPRNFSNYRKGLFWVSFAGALMNFFLGTMSGLLFAIIATRVPENFAFYSVLLETLKYSMMINFVLGAFNLIPLPPLDGSKMVMSFLKGEAARKYEGLAQYTNMIFLVIIALSFMGISTIGYVITPVVMIGQKLTMYFLYLLG